ncbi:phosphomannomutase/phosphoglucomutase [Tetragenococcus koreensis]|uniref:Phosphomannomutase/phosphoglucomutase n=1 Tax=Tetragenococcus koreensis TaxID=290335 RepID=A0AAN4UDT4_9ENTE|nr:phosphomannomutase/phosphoglucomutase [Tetragenococcus koreensis]MDN6840402.1 phosphomannomutase/phosphoglucomutase [Tetragenococcus halophilus]MCF1586426.1 phosphomannomutase/phosphoglucomutase [Tetragenococcus koreensis]MCF1615973.1 phosphomannomutase/phosphoglucomutase [Tetragenococcus koreensis]MCF1618157.1 phosphomannomutase/phosphoglucomutase [Tetragenococcus koreensis]MCF1620838.1 phosphomannomutase/phosphoglucomutase [Tetragenococcus koreensis]
MGKLVDLQNESDIRGVAIDTQEHQANLTVTAVREIAVGIVNWLHEKGIKDKLTIGVGRDSRLSGPKLQEALIEVLTSYDVEVYDFGLATTPALFMSTQFSQFSCDAGIMLTASHLPYYYNGVKVFSQKGGAEKEDIAYILTHTESSEHFGAGTVTKADLLTVYANDLVEKIRTASKKKQEKPLNGFKIVVDAGNGAGGFFAEKVLQPLGADTSGSQFLAPDGNFPNHVPNPDNKEAMQSIQKAVLANQADLGVIFDTDVDRSAVVTKSGDVLNRNNLIAVLSRITLNEHSGTSIVTNSPTSDHLKVFIEALGGKQVRYISGYRNVINKAQDLNQEGVDSQLAIETSGHAAFKENYFLDDGAYVIAKILMLLPELQAEGKTLESLIADLKQPLETQEVRFKLEADDYRALGEQVIEQIADIDIFGWEVDPENEEGIRFRLSQPYGQGWFLLRMSLHEPLLVLQVENDEAGHILPVLKKMQQFLNNYPDVNQEKLVPLIQSQ